MSFLSGLISAGKEAVKLGGALIAGGPVAAAAVGATDIIKATQGQTAASNASKGLPVKQPAIPALQQAAAAANPYNAIPASYTIPSTSMPTVNPYAAAGSPYATYVQDTLPSVPGVGPAVGPPTPPTIAQAELGGCHKQLFQQAIARPSYHPPRGYVTVDQGAVTGNPSLIGQKVWMLKGCAVAMGLYHARRKPPISAGDWHAFKRAERVEKKLARVAKSVGYVQKRSVRRVERTERPARRRKVV